MDKGGRALACHTQGHDYGHRLSLSRSLAVEVKDRGDKGTEATALHGINYLPANLFSFPFIFANSVLHLLLQEVFCTSPGWRRRFRALSDFPGFTSVTDLLSVLYFHDSVVIVGLYLGLLHQTMSSRGLAL